MARNKEIIKLVEKKLDNTVLQTFEGVVPSDGHIQKMATKHIGNPYIIRLYVHGHIIRREGDIPNSGRIHMLFKEYAGNEYKMLILNKDWKIRKPFVNLKDVKTCKVEWHYIKCPQCGHEVDGITGYTINQLLEDIKYKRKTNINLKLAKKQATKEGFFFPCFECGYVYSRNPQKTKFQIKKVDGLICPKCRITISKTQENLSLSNVGYMCPSCLSFLEYTGYPHHGSMEVQVISTTDYFHGKCPNCKPEDGIDSKWGMMVLGDQIWVEDEGKLVLPLVCTNCGYRDTIKIGTLSGRRPKILTKWP